MLDPRLGDEQRDKIADDAKAKLASGEIEHEATWGVRKMAYEIEKQPEADYRFYRFSADKSILDELEHSLRITDGVLRFRIFKTDADAPTAQPPETAQIMRRDEDDRGGRREGGRGPRRPRSDSGPSGDGERRSEPARSDAG